jgi:phytoene synthase
LRAFGHVSAQGRIMLPWSILEANGVRESEIFACQESESLHAALSQVAELAQDHLEKARSAIATLPPPLRPAFGAIAVLEAQLVAWHRRHTSPFAAPPDDADWRKIARLAWWTWRNR